MPEVQKCRRDMKNVPLFKSGANIFIRFLNSRFELNFLSNLFVQNICKNSLNSDQDSPVFFQSEIVKFWPRLQLEEVDIGYNLDVALEENGITSQLGNSDFIQKLEELMSVWCKQIELVLTKSEQMRKEADDIGF